MSKHKAAKAPAVPNRGSIALRRVMQRRGLSQGDVREATRVTPGVVSRWLTGERCPSLVSAIRLRDEYKIKLEWWLEEPEADEEPARAVGF